MKKKKKKKTTTMYFRIHILCCVLTNVLMFYDCIQPSLLHGLTEKQPLADVSTVNK